MAIIVGSDSDDPSLDGTDRADTISGLGGSDVIHSRGTDIWTGEVDTLIGGPGNDFLYNDYGRAKYIVAGDWGKDTIYSGVYGDAYQDTIVFEDLARSEVKFVEDGESLYIHDMHAPNTGNYVRIPHWFTNEDVYTFEFNGTADPASLSLTTPSVTKDEGNSGATTEFAFGVARTGDLSTAADVSYAVTGSGASPAGAADFAGGVLPGGTVSFAAGSTSQVIRVNVAGDASVEPDEGFTLTLSDPTNGATLGTASAAGTIRNEDVAAPANVATAGDDTLAGSSGDDRIDALGGNDTVSAGGGNDTAIGGAGDDALYGQAGNDTLYGRTGKDRLDGGGGTDRLLGEGGDDLLAGGAGKDTLTGGTEGDRFDFNSAGDAGLGASRDVILDYNRTQFDRIDLATIDAKAGVAGDQAFTFRGTNAFSANAEGQLRANDLGSTVVLQGSTDADRTPEFEIEMRNFTGPVTPTSDYFFL